MELMLEITRKLEDLGDSLNEIIAILNLPTANFCEKRAERVEVSGGLEQSCRGCVTQNLVSGKRLPLEEVKRVIDYFATQYGTRFITINGRGDPFHPRLKEETLEKIRYAREEHGIQSYVFTAGSNLDEETCRTLAESEVNVMISLYGNRFIDAEFFEGKEYPSSQKPLQDLGEIAGNLRRLIRAYDRVEVPFGLTRLGMNYVVSESDLEDDSKLRDLKLAANKNKIFFICNTDFIPHKDAKTQRRLEQLARKYSDFNIRHSTAVNDQCQMGAGSSATVDFDGSLLRCPYMGSECSDGKFDPSKEDTQKILREYMQDRSLPCVMRKHQE